MKESPCNHAASPTNPFYHPTEEPAEPTCPIINAAILPWSRIMVIITNPVQIAVITDTSLRQLIERRIQEISECCPWDADELGPMIVVEPGDTAEDLQAIMGFSILESIFDDSHFGDEEFAPSFDFAEIVGEDLYELVYVISDGGYGYDIFIPNLPGLDPVIRSFCQTYAIPNPTYM